MIRSLCILGFPLSLGISVTIDMSYRLRGLALRSAMEVMLWWSFHILSIKSSFSFEHWTSSGVRREWWCPRWRPEGEVVVFSFQLRNPFLYSSSGMVCCWKDFIISLFLVKLSRYRLVTLVRGIWCSFVFSFNSASTNGVSLSVPRRDCKGSTVKGEPWAWLIWWELRSNISSLIRVGFSIVLNTTFFVPFMLSQGMEESVGISMVWIELFVLLLVVNQITFHIFIICSILLMLVIVFLAALLLAISIAETLWIR